MTKKTQWRLRNFKKRLNRIYKGLSDIIAVLLMIIGLISVAWGTLMFLMLEWSAVLWISIGMGLTYLAFETVEYGRS
jgi:TRAP-type C4-dicarboxylate transport system permease small subunit